jgi:hypothetical protein
VFGKHLAFASRLGRKACVDLHAYLGLGREEGGERLLFRGRYGDDEYNCCMTRTSLHFFCLYLLLVYIEERLSNAKGVIGLICYQNRAEKPGHR